MTPQDGQSDGDWGLAAEHSDEMAEAWDRFDRLPDPGGNDALDAFVAAKHIDIPSLVRVGTRLSSHDVLAFAYPGGIKYRNIETGERWAYHGSEFTGLKIVRAHGTPAKLNRLRVVPTGAVHRGFILRAP